jgi:glutamyl/glutaminyl-tRNA synthetase
MQIVSRIAPTPSGYLHIGNAVNFLLTWLAVKLRGGTLLLRIDDLDRDRCKEAYVDDVFASLAWLGIEPDGGPSGVADFYARFSQTARFDTYRAALERMRENGAALFACDCSRKQLAGMEVYPGTCRTRGLDELLPQTAVRIAVPDHTDIAVGDETVALDRTMGDFIVWRRDNVPAYQLVSVVEDERLGVNLVIRGNDLLTSSAAQRFLAPFLGARTFSAASVIHHDLILRHDGGKFSKSDNDLSLRFMRRDMGERPAREATLLETQRLLRLSTRKIDRAEQLLECCRQALFDEVPAPILAQLAGRTVKGGT